MLPISFYSLKRFLTSFIMLSFIFYLSKALNFELLYAVKKLITFLKRNKSLLYSLEKAFETTIFKVIQVILCDTKVL